MTMDIPQSARGVTEEEQIRQPQPVQESLPLPVVTNQDFLDGCFMGQPHPTRHLSRQGSNDVQRYNINVRYELGLDIDKYLRDLEQTYDSADSLQRHNITPALRARMVDWMIEVLTNFKCDDQTFFIAVSLQDRFFKGCPQIKEVSDLHLSGVTCMFIASKYEDIYPLKMKTVYDKIAHQKLEIKQIKNLELEMMRVIDYKIHAPTVLDFLKVYLVEVLGVEIKNRTETKKKEEVALKINNGELEIQDTTMTAHDVQ